MFRIIVTIKGIVENALNKPCVRGQMDKINDEQFIESLCEVWDDAEEIKNSDRHTNEMRVVWIACGNIIWKMYLTAYSNE